MRSVYRLMLYLIISDFWLYSDVWVVHYATCAMGIYHYDKLMITLRTESFRYYIDCSLLSACTQYMTLYCSRVVAIPMHTICLSLIYAEVHGVATEYS